MNSDDDSHWMQVALELAVLGRGHVEPNPMVGCVLVRDGRLIGQGYHRVFGGPHAEVDAINHCDDPRGATAYVTLEPCCHHGKTPPCTDALIDAGITRVVIGSVDPDRRVDGGGIAALRSRGIDVSVAAATDRGRDVLAPFIKRTTTGMPWVIAKWAMTVDGRIATATGHSQWISDSGSRADVHRTRGLVDVIATAMGTVAADDPLLTARPAGPRRAARWVHVRRRLPACDSRLVAGIAQAPVVLAIQPDVPDRPTDFDQQLRRLIDRGVEVEWAEDGAAEDRHDGGGHLRGVLRRMSDRGATNVLLEAGPGLLGSYFDAGLIDEYHVYVGGKAFGGATAAGPIGGRGVGRIEHAVTLRITELSQLGRDVKIVYRPTAE